MDQKTFEAPRSLGSMLARPMSDEEIALVGGGAVSSAERALDPGTHGPEDHSPTGNPCTDCD